MVRLNAPDFQQIDLNNQLTPAEGPKVIPLNLDFSAATDYRIDLSLIAGQARMTMVQTLWIDLSSTDSELIVTVEGTNQLIIAKGRTQGYYTVLAPNPTMLVFSMDNGPAGLPIGLINVPVAGVVWTT